MKCISYCANLFCSFLSLSLHANGHSHWGFTWRCKFSAFKFTIALWKQCNDNDTNTHGHLVTCSLCSKMSFHLSVTLYAICYTCQFNCVSSLSLCLSLSLSLCFPLPLSPVILTSRNAVNLFQSYVDLNSVLQCPFHAIYAASHHTLPLTWRCPCNTLRNVSSLPARYRKRDESLTWAWRCPSYLVELDHPHTNG